MPPALDRSTRAELSAAFSPFIKTSAFALLLSPLLAGSAFAVVSGTGFNPYTPSTFVATTTMNVPLDNIPDPLHGILSGSTATSLPQTHWQDGYLDVTKDPYRASGTASGSDNAIAIQEAMHDGFYYNFTVYIPAGTYAVDQPLASPYPEPKKISPNLKYCNVMVGSSTGGRSVLQYTGTATVNPFINLELVSGTSGTAGPVPDQLYGATFRSIDIDMGNHPDSNALKVEGSQNCDIEDVTISGQSFHAGVIAPPASGGSINKLTVIGGDIGIFSNIYRPNPVFAGITLIGQNTCGIQVNTARGPICLVGFDISNTTASGSYMAISGSVPPGQIGSSSDPRGDINMLDGRITISSTSGIGVYNNNALVNIAMRNVYIQAPTLVKGGTFALSGTPGGYNHITKYVFTTGSAQGGNIYDMDNGWGTSGTAPAAYQEYDTPIVLATPPADLVSRHTGRALPPLLGGNTLSVTSTISGTYATPDVPGDDDAIAINNAINQAASGTVPMIVTLPRGHYHIKSPIHLKDGVTLLGGGKNSSILQIVTSATFSGTTPTTLFTVDSSGTNPTKGVTLQDFGLWGIVASTSATSTTAPNNMKNVTLLRIENSDVTMRDVVTTKYVTTDNGPATEAAAPIVEMDGDAGGRFYDLCLYKFEASATTSANSFHLLHVVNTTHPIYIYSPSIEHQDVGGSQIAFDHAQNVHIIGLKMEGENQSLQVNDSDNCSIFGESGEAHSNASLLPLIKIDNSSDRLWYSLLDRTILSTDTGTYPWISMATSPATTLPGRTPVALFKQGDSPILADGLTETFSNSTSNFPVSSTPGYSYSTDIGGFGPCLYFNGSGTAPSIYSTQNRVNTTQGYQVSTRLKMSSPNQGMNSPQLIFLGNPVFHTFGTPYNSARIKSNGSLMIVGPNISEIDVNVVPYLNGNPGYYAKDWNQISVQVTGTSATFFINGKNVYSSTDSNLLSYALDPDTTVGVKGSDNVSCYFDHFSCYPLY